MFGGIFILKIFFIAITDIFLAILSLFSKTFFLFLHLFFRNNDNNDIDENIENNIDNDKIEFDESFLGKQIQKLKNSLDIHKSEDDTFIFEHLQNNSFFTNQDDNNDKNYFSIKNDTLNITNSSQTLQKGYLNKIFGKIITEKVNINRFILIIIILIVIFTILCYIFLGIEIAIAIILLFLMGLASIFYLPKMNKDKRDSEISRELPYALRQMVTELRSGKGLHDTIDSIANSDYGALSDEFSRVIKEIKYGENTEMALLNMSKRVSSEGTKRAIQQIIGTLRTGGNLASTLNIIAEDVTHDLQIKLKDYSQKLNAFIMIYTFLAILGPVILLIMLMAASTVMGDIVPSNVVLILYIFFFPMIVVFMGLMIKRLEPKL